jgi:transposase
MVAGALSAEADQKKRAAWLYSEIVKLYRDRRLSYTQIAEIVCVSKACVGVYVKKWRVGVPLEDIRSRGGQSILTAANKQRIRCLIATNPHISSKGISAELKVPNKQGNSVEVSARTIRRALRQMSYKNLRPTPVPAITQVQKTKRVKWCKSHAKTDWQNVLFTDETTIELQRCKAKIWHHKQSPPMLPKTKHSPKRMFWARICWPRTLHS